MSSIVSYNHEVDPYTRPSFPLRNKLLRVIWGIVYNLLFKLSPRPFHEWRSFLLRCFGARVGRKCRIYPLAKIWAPWNLICEDVVVVADEAIIYNPSPIHLCSHSTISQQAYLCGASHDFDGPDFKLISKPIYIEAYVWVCARSTVLMGLTLEEGSILGLGSIATKNLESWSVYVGIPAKKVKQRCNFLFSINSK
ncbi:LbetaH domain-containing protein [Acaryochloris marina]|uniref:putative colanic acid biosynthesis acetyltransferase n=1 Tax=Acaryochloris marina TaxID=155978 RepID=UPI0021C3DD70|nr:putative colanic acid biosynthesis acetyltransferase [Acaryochloris marina]BDM80323.1 acetyltransferase [Acaryochloris marina MBIC10699]